MKTRILSLLLVLVLLASLLPTTTLAVGLGLETAPKKCEHPTSKTVQIIVENNCVVDGYIKDYKVCIECGEEFDVRVFPLGKATGHKWDNGICTVCGAESPFQTAPKCQHDKTHTKQTIVEATCTEGGYIHHALVCNECGEEVSAEDYALTEAAGHKWDDGICTVCGAESPFQTAPDATTPDAPSDNVPETPSEDVPVEDPSEDEPAYPADPWKYLTDLFSPWL